MVSNALNVELEELLQTLNRLRDEHAEDPEYRAWRAELPADWSL